MAAVSCFRVQAAVADELRATAAYMENGVREATDAQAELRKSLKDEQENALQSNKKAMSLVLPSDRSCWGVVDGPYFHVAYRTHCVGHVPASNCIGRRSKLKTLVLSIAY